MSVTSTDLQNLIIDTLSNADATVLAGLRSVVPQYWILWNRQGYLPELQYWYTRRDAIRYVQAFVKGQIDFLRRNMTASRDMTASSRQDTRMDAVSTENATSNADRSSSSVYSDASNSSGSGSSSSSRNASQTTTGSGAMLDDGSGSNLASQSSTYSSNSTINASSCDSSASTLIGRQTVSNGGLDNLGNPIADGPAFHNRNHSATKEGVGATGGIDIGIGVDLGGSSNRTITYELEDGSNVTTNSQDGQSKFVSRLSDARANTMSQSASQSSSSSFNAHRTTSDSLVSSGSSRMASSSTSTFSMTGSGSGSMTGSGLGGSTMTASSTRAAVSTGDAHRVSVAASNTTLTMEKLHQRFLHLQDLWEKATEMIQWYEKQRLAIPVYVFQSITLQYPDGLNADAANQMLVKTPYGTPRASNLLGQ